MMKQKISTFGLVAVFFLGLTGIAQAADYPARSITLINPMPPGGTLDIQAREDSGREVARPCVCSLELSPG